jgi:hypothetical protein
MYIAYIDESGEVGRQGTTHFVLIAFAIPAGSWKAKDREIERLKVKYRIPEAEAHTAFMARRYIEQEHIPNFATLSDADRRAAVAIERKKALAQTALRGHDAVKAMVKTYKKTEAYVHLTRAERAKFLQDFADIVGAWNDCRLFGDAQMKAAHVGDPERMREFAFEQVVARFQTFLTLTAKPDNFGLLVHDQNETAAHRLTKRMRAFHRSGTAFATIPNIIETPLFVDSELTSMVQVADLVAYAVRRFLENKEQDLFTRVYSAFDRNNGVLVGLRHFTAQIPCTCKICQDHRPQRDAGT